MSLCDSAVDAPAVREEATDAGAIRNWTIEDKSGR